ncbi:MAG TPA: ATP-binding protein [Usitatibacter sp.]|nr:ATP-binding protein [Usitatibacter sp.]
MTSRQLRIVHDAARATQAPAKVRLPLDFKPDTLLESPALQAMLERGLQTIIALTGARGGTVRLVSPDGQWLRLVSAMGVSCGDLADHRALAVDCGICGVALRADDMRLDRHPESCARYLAPFAGHTKCGPVLAVPLHCSGKPIGVFSLFFGSRVPVDLAELLDPTARMLDLVLENAVFEHERLRSSLLSERQLLAGEVHDALAQGLAYMRMRMSLLHDAIRNGERTHALKYFGDVNQAMGEAHARLRELISHFRQPISHGLLPSLQDMARTFEDRTGVRLTIENQAGDVRWTAEQEHEVYRIVQEALANVVKHAGAHAARVLIDRRAAKLRVSVEDDGCGVSRDAGQGPTGHYGMDIMRERAQRLGATLRIRSNPGKGTCVRLTLPAQPRPLESTP